MFLKSRLQSRMMVANTGVLVSSEHGDACCYELTGKETPTGIALDNMMHHMIL